MRFRFLLRYFQALASSLYLFSAGFLFSRNRLLIHQICSHFRAPQGKGNPLSSKEGPLLPQVELAAVAPEDIPVQIREPAEVKGEASLYEIIAIARLAKSLRPLNLFEIGTFHGRTTLNLAANSPEEAIVHTLDLLPADLSSACFPIAPGEECFIRKDMAGRKFLNSDCARKISQLLGDSAAFDYGPLWGTMDFIFIDGSHAYDYVLRDSLSAMKLLKAGRGAILWHDYGRWEGVTKGLNSLFLSDDRFKGLVHIKGTTLAYGFWGSASHEPET